MSYSTSLSPQFLISESTEVYTRLLPHQFTLKGQGFLGIWSWAATAAQGLGFSFRWVEKCLCGDSSQILPSLSGWRSKVSRLDSGESMPLAKGQRWGLRCQVAY